MAKRKILKWATDQRIKLQFIQKGRPTPNAYIERFNRTYRKAVLDCYLLNTLDDVRAITQEWQEHYKHHRPHDSLGNLTPIEYLRKGQANPMEAAKL
jgi:putative transposase